MAASGQVSIQPYRPSFLQVPGKSPIPWNRWKDMYEDYLLAVGFPTPAVGALEFAAVAQRKAALLRASLGTEGYRLYCTLTVDPRERYEDAVTKLAAYFEQPSSAIFARAQFTRCQQRPGETVAQYVTTLREMAAKCEFAAEQLNERVRDQLVCVGQNS